MDQETKKAQIQVNNEEIQRHLNHIFNLMTFNKELEESIK